MSVITIGSIAVPPFTSSCGVSQDYDAFNVNSTAACPNPGIYPYVLQWLIRAMNSSFIVKQLHYAEENKFDRDDGDASTDVATTPSFYIPPNVTHTTTPVSFFTNVKI